MNNVRLKTHYLLSPSARCLTLLSSLYVASCLCLCVLPISLALIILLLAGLDWLRWVRRYAWLTAKDAIIELTRLSPQAGWLCVDRAGRRFPVQLEQVLCIFPGVLKLQGRCISTHKNVSFFVAKDMLLGTDYHQFVLLSRSSSEMSKN